MAEFEHKSVNKFRVRGRRRLYKIREFSFSKRKMRVSKKREGEGKKLKPKGENGFGSTWRLRGPASLRRNSAHTALEIGTLVGTRVSGF